jgi:hypothetical protein
MSAEEEKKEEPTKVADAEVRSRLTRSQASDSAQSSAHSMWAGIMQERSARMELVRTQKISPLLISPGKKTSPTKEPC